MSKFSYPPDFYENIKARWNTRIWPDETIPDLPDKGVFQKLVNIVYHASFLTEERRKIWFRVVYAPQKTITEKSERGIEAIKVVKFDNPRIINVSELVKLAPAADPTHVLIGVHENDSKELEIWGLIEGGTSWWDFLRHESSSGMPPPNAFTLSSKKPGQISITRQGWIIAILDQGKIAEPSSGVFYQGPVAEFLKIGIQKLYEEVCRKLKRKKFDPKGRDDDYPKRAYIFLLERILNRIRERFHGGTIIMIPDSIDINDTRMRDRIVIKYPCHCNDAWESLVNELILFRNYFDMHFKLWDKTQITQDEFHQDSRIDSHYEKSKEMVKRSVGFLSSLSAVDGAIVITDKLRLLGFGAEIIAPSPSLDKVKIISDFEKNIGDYINIEFFGTRHRSAFRFCSSFEDSVIFIVSQDGEIRIVKRVGPEVLVWSNINIGSLGF